MCSIYTSGVFALKTQINPSIQFHSRNFIECRVFASPNVLTPFEYKEGNSIEVSVRAVSHARKILNNLLCHVPEKVVSSAILSRFKSNMNMNWALFCALRLVNSGDEIEGEMGHKHIGKKSKYLFVPNFVILGGSQ
jgi:hypothetical protein